MKSIKKLSVLLLVVVALSACSTSRYMAKNVNTAEVTPMVLVQPLAYMEYVERDGNVVLDTKTAETNSALIEQNIRHYFPEVSKVIPLDVAASRENLEIELMEMPYLNIGQIKKQSGYYFLNELRNTILEQGYRYGIAVFSAGFTRDSKNYKNEVLKSAVIGLVSTIVSLGTVTVIGDTSKFGSKVYLMIYDAEQSSIVYFGKSVPSEANPLNEKTLSRQISALRERYE